MPNEKYTNALNGIAQKIPPVWMMRQAGRYHKHYQTLRAKYSFEELCKNPDLAAEVAYGPVNEFDFDVAILFFGYTFSFRSFGNGTSLYGLGTSVGFRNSF